MTVRKPNGTAAAYRQLVGITRDQTEVLQAVRDALLESNRESHEQGTVLGKLLHDHEVVMAALNTAQVERNEAINSIFTAVKNSGDAVVEANRQALVNYNKTQWKWVWAAGVVVFLSNALGQPLGAFLANAIRLVVPH